MENNTEEIKHKPQNKTFYCDDETWIKFRQLCMGDKISATGKIKELIKGWIVSKES